MSIKESFLQRHLIWQYIFFILGLLLFAKCGKEFWLLDFSADNTAFLIVFGFGIAIGGLLMASPIFIRNWAKNKID